MAYLLLCDDDAAFAASLQSQIEALFPAWGMDIHIATEERAYRRLVRSLGLPALVFMDIEFGAANGLQLAAEAHTVMPEVPFIFVTAHNARYSQQLFLQDIHVIGYLEKPVKESLLQHLLFRASKIIDAAKPQLALHINRKTILLDTADIVFLESDGHRVTLHLLDETSYVQRTRLAVIEANLPDDFLRIHVSFLINMKYITALDGHEVTLCDSVTLPVSRNMAKAAQMHYLRYRGNAL